MFQDLPDYKKIKFAMAFDKGILPVGSFLDCCFALVDDDRERPCFLLRLGVTVAGTAFALPLIDLMYGQWE